MEDTLDHLPPKKQRQLRALAELIRAEAKVEMVVLFGSHARGDWVADPVGDYFSDFDVLVIVKSPSLVDKLDLWAKIEERAQKIAAPTELSLIVHDIKDVNEQLEKGFYFFSDVKREGIVLHDSGKFELAEAKERTQEERRAQAQVWFEEWFKSANEFFQYFEFGVSQGNNKSAAFQLHQATERYYHTVLLVLSAYKPKTHNLEDLGKRAGDLHPELRNVFPQNTPAEERLFKLLKKAYVDARYSSKYVITAEELAGIAGWVRDLRDRVERVCVERIAAMGQSGA